MGECVIGNERKWEDGGIIFQKLDKGGGVVILCYGCAWDFGVLCKGRKRDFRINLES